MSSSLVNYLNPIREHLEDALKRMEKNDVPTSTSRLPYPIRPHVELASVDGTKKSSNRNNNTKKTMKNGIISNNSRCGERKPSPSSCSKTKYSISKKEFVHNGGKEKCLIESSINSVRVSFLFKQQNQTSADPIEQSILWKYMKFFQRRAETYQILRRQPIDGYSISFLILSTHVFDVIDDTNVDNGNKNDDNYVTSSMNSTVDTNCKSSNKNKKKNNVDEIVNVIIDFASQFDRECSHVKISVNARARLVATEFLKSF